MTTIINLSTIDSVSGGDLIPAYDMSAGTARKMSVSQLLAFFTANFASPQFSAVISSPIDGFNQVLEAAATSIWVILNPAGTLASGTLTLPPVADCFDGQEILVVSTQQIGGSGFSSKLNIAGNGATLSVSDFKLSAGSNFRLRYNALLSTWYCVDRSPMLTETFLAVAVTDISGNLAEIVDVSCTNLFAEVIEQTPIAVAALGSAVNPGQRKFVTDANATTFASIVAGGGANVVPVYSDGTNWRIG